MLTKFGIFCCEYWTASTILLLGVFLLWKLIWQPAARLFLARTTLIALVLLALLCGLSGGFFLNLLPIDEPIVRSEEKGQNFKTISLPPGSLVFPPAQQQQIADLIDHLPNETLQSMFGQEANSTPLPIIAIEKEDENTVSFAVIVAWVQIFGMALIFCRLLLGNIYAIWLCRRAEFFKTDGRIQVLVSKAVWVPMVLGLLRPRILIPDSLIQEDQSQSEQLRLALFHEMAHIRNGDLKTIAFWQILSPFLVLQPHFWLFRRKIRREQEFLADASVTDIEANRKRYAEELLRWAMIVRTQPQRHLVSVIGLASMLGICEEE